MRVWPIVVLGAVVLFFGVPRHVAAASSGTVSITVRVRPPAGIQSGERAALISGLVAIGLKAIRYSATAITDSSQLLIMPGFVQRLNERSKRFNRLETAY